jgi:hypothetical protein
MMLEKALIFWVAKTWFFLLMQRFVGKAWFLLFCHNFETVGVHDTVQYRYCIFSLFYHLLSIRLKRQNPLLSYVRERERERESTM